MYTGYLLFKNSLFLAINGCLYSVQHATTHIRVHATAAYILVYQPCARARRGTVEVHHIREHDT